MEGGGIAVRFLAFLLLLLQANPSQPKQDISTPVAHSGNSLQTGNGIETMTWASTKRPSKDKRSTRKTANPGFWQRKRKVRLNGSECFRLSNEKKVNSKTKIIKMRKRKTISTDESFRKVSIGQGWPRRGVIGFIQRHSDADSANYA